MGCSWILCVLLSLLYITVQAQFECDEYLGITCVVNSAQEYAVQLLVIEEADLIITDSGSIACTDPQCTIQINVDTTVSIDGNITSGILNINAAFVTISSTGVLNTNGQGYNAGEGPGGGEATQGGSYGGFSSSCNPVNNNAGAPYGSYLLPNDMGSGGGNSVSGTGGSGGGFVTINVEEVLILDGIITANGQMGTNSSGGGSGGAIVLNARAISGSGSISANGGGSDRATGGLGSGGRISIAGNITASIQIFAYGQRSAQSTCPQAAAGTIYYAQNDTLVLDNNVTATALPSGPITNGLTPVPQGFVSSIWAKNSAVMLISDYLLNTSSITLRGGSLSCGACLRTGMIYATSSLDIGSSSLVVLDKWWYFTSAEVTMDGTMYGASLIFTADTMEVAGWINTNGGGFGSGLGPGAGMTAPADCPGGGAAHGANGMPSCGTATGGESYDNPSNPTVPGSGGGNSGTLLGGAGGGFIQIKSIYFTLSGNLTANGIAGIGSTLQTQESDLENLPYTGAGGGSGGAISITATSLRLVGTASVTAHGGNGGSGSLSGGGGSGGCIFLNGSIMQANSAVYVGASGGVTGCKNYVNNGTLLSHCQQGYSGENVFPCQPCAEGYYSTDGYRCYPCSPGYSTNNLAAQPKCSACSLGYAAPNSGSPTCLMCGTGTFANTSGSTQCLQCNPGTIAPYLGSPACTPCGAGKYYSGFGGTTCATCPYQTFTNTTGQATCFNCSSGYISSRDFTSCTPCGPGTYAATSICYSCYPGTYSNKSANAVCTYCDAGSYQSNYGYPYCSKCPAGRYQGYSGGSYCNYCSRGSFSNAGAIICTRCSPGTYQPNDGESWCYPCPSATTYGQYYCPSSSTSYSSYSSYSSCSSNCGPDNSPGEGLAVFFSIVGAIIGILFVVICVYLCCRRNRLQYEAIPPGRNPSPPGLPNNSRNNNRNSVPYQPPPHLPPLPPPRNAGNAVLATPAVGDDATKQECIICCDAKRETVLLPCGHITACEQCTRQLLTTRPPRCPVCRHPVVTFVRMYTA